MKKEEVMERLQRKGLRGEGGGVLSTEEREVVECCTFTPRIRRGHWSSEVMGNNEMSPAGAYLEFDGHGGAQGETRRRALEGATGRSP